MEALQDRLGGLLREREELRKGDAGWLALERNRRKVVRAQWELTYAFVARYGTRST